MISVGDHRAFDKNFSTLSGGNILSIVIDQPKISKSILKD